MTSLAAFAAFAAELADTARAVTLTGMGPALTAENKAAAGGFDPVTAADREAEQAMRRLIAARFPGHGVVGEEYGETAGDRYVWSLDPIDGTRAYLCGLPSWTTLIALLDNGRPVIGLIDAPALDERYFAYAGAGRLIAAGGVRTLRASACRSLAEARLTTTDPFLFEGDEAAGFERLRRSVRLVRYGQDAYGYARLAAGSIDLVVESGLKPHDVHALIPVVEASGGTIGDWDGGADLARGRIVAASTRALYDEAVRTLAGR